MNLKIVNAGKSSFPVAWPNYNTCASYDGLNMFRVPTTYDKEKGILSWTFMSEHVSLSDIDQANFSAPAEQEQGMGFRAYHRCIDVCHCQLLVPTK